MMRKPRLLLCMLLALSLALLPLPVAVADESVSKEPAAAADDPRSEANGAAVGEPTLEAPAAVEAEAASEEHAAIADESAPAAEASAYGAIPALGQRSTEVVAGDFVLSDASGGGPAPSNHDYEIEDRGGDHYVLKLKSGYAFAIGMKNGVPVTDKCSIEIVDGGPSKVVFNDVKIALNDGDDSKFHRSALLFAKTTSDAVFEFNGTCEMKGSGGSAGIQKDSAASTLSLEGGVGSDLKATGGNAGGAGIGGSARIDDSSKSNGSDIAIKNFVSVTAQGGAGAAGIGGGKGGAGTKITIENSTVTAQGAGGGAGIGGGENGAGEDLSIINDNSGKTVTATGAGGGAGIGGGLHGEGCSISVKETGESGERGSKVIATGSEGGAGIGGGAGVKGDGIEIDTDRLNSIVTATGGDATDKVGGGAGIGGGWNGDGRNIKITNARWVGATGGAEEAGNGGGAGIGGGAGGNGDTITISRDTQIVTTYKVVAQGGAIFQDSDKKIELSTNGGAGIGGGASKSGQGIKVENMTLEVRGGGGGAGIGGGFGGEGSGIELRGEGGGSAKGSRGGAGVGGGQNGIGRNITISGTPITDVAGGADGGAGIGGGAGAPAETITFANLSKDINATALGGGAGIGGGSNASATGISISTRFPITATSKSGSALVNGEKSSAQHESNYLAAPEVSKGFLYEISTADDPVNPKPLVTCRAENEKTPLSEYTQKYVQIKYRCNAGGYFLAYEDGTPVAYNDAKEFTYSSLDGLAITGSGSYKLAMAVEGASSYDPISIRNGCTVEVESLNVGPNSGAALSVDTPEDVMLKFTGSSILKGGSSHAGLRKQGEGTLTIDGPGSLEAFSADGGGSGIGNSTSDDSAAKNAVKNIEIVGGTIKAYGKQAIGSSTAAPTENVAFAPQLGMQVNAKGGTTEWDMAPFLTDWRERALLDGETFKRIEAEFSPALFALTVAGGTDLTGSSPYAMGAQVEIKADPAPAGKIFDKWVCAAGSLADASSEQTTFTMPAQAATVTATFRDLVFEKRTLSDPATGVSVTAEFAENAEILVAAAQLHEPDSCKACDAIRDAQEKGLLAALWDVSIGGGGYTGKPTVSIPVEKKLEGRDAFVLHDADHALESVPTKIASGKANAELSSLSPVAVALAEPPVEGKSLIPSLGDVPGAPIAAAAALIAALALVASVARRRREEG